MHHLYAQQQSDQLEPRPLNQKFLQRTSLMLPCHVQALWCDLE
ncbi:hypothetical protein COO91_00145 [Nostoc flagelliforme CCNUN1]|uniref:Uncharacterized protein n=1 Tax=Nostoc flagelliforme CCNUN1 TaxID=2038116 RepID=A0A2K8SHL0_9NOSO|nr:hypothetical protein COO91_00145 [Nostoc flagelliforme CCNUN1]